MEETLTIQETAALLKMSYNTVYARKLELGFFKIVGIRGWRIYKRDLDRNIEKENNNSRLCVQIGKEKQQCRSEKQKMASGKSISQRRTASEFDVLVARLKRN
ncbi:helix-turn-helix domain-containing protein [Pasteurella multocida]|uniref:helix-turn-helix domain-containing protein n=1 Tax=Pasteurella multocida TaxID=747 RepID=UPI000B644B0D|nr:helix-turn-helix domain-containing protein [Pasteurella multocida]MBF6982364.1 helix-turn-helix domain-containing protein [Pasteurella multocida]MBF6986017.1 helix-turn-helix domain-containing protein [Pasteurella multocida]MDA5609367.1 helix-turn-helix domain-containing protein [Pasteurella multocida subsp. multocida]MDA5616882.1 helix-turn-helix domain-containing protein [Pasteurella multocida]MDA5626899.1 helix-turn-helix domain-containing protein [Pasteurella multocida]